MLKKIISFVLSFALITSQPVFAQGVAQINLGNYLRTVGSSVAMDKFRPLHMRYFSYDALSDNFQLLLDKGDNKDIKEAELEEKTKVLMDYFKIGLSLPNEKFWVNLRPDAQDQIIDPELEKTDMGKIMLEADLQLKKDTAGLTSPQNPEGKAYWDKLYKKAGELFGSENITIPTITRPWIVPGEIILRQGEDSAYIFKANMKVMLEQDHLKGSQVYDFKDPRMKELNEYSSQLIRELIIPRLTKEVNTSKRYAALRQVFFSLVMARWFKDTFGSSGSISAPDSSYIKLIDSGDLTSLTSKESWSKTYYFNEYKKSFEKGEYNLKEEITTPTGQVIRSYVSGGISYYRFKEWGKFIVNKVMLPTALFLSLLNLTPVTTEAFSYVTIGVPGGVGDLGDSFYENAFNKIREAEKNNGALPAFQTANVPGYISNDYIVHEYIRRIIEKEINKTGIAYNAILAKIINEGELRGGDIFNIGNLEVKIISDPYNHIFRFKIGNNVIYADRNRNKLEVYRCDVSRYGGELTKEEIIAKIKEEIVKPLEGVLSSSSSLIRVNRNQFTENGKRFNALLTTEGAPEELRGFVGTLEAFLVKYSYTLSPNLVAGGKTGGWTWEDDKGGVKKSFEQYRALPSFDKEGLLVGLRLEKGLTKYNFIYSENKWVVEKQEIQASSAIKQPGGIDFRAMNYLVQPMGSFKDLQFGLPILTSSALERIDLDAELEKLRDMVKNGMVPSGMRVKEYLAACFQKGKIEEKQDDLLVCLAEIYRLAEEENLETSPELRESLVIVDTGKFVLLPNNQKVGLN